MQDLYSTGPTQGACARSYAEYTYRAYGYLLGNMKELRVHSINRDACSYDIEEAHFGVKKEKWVPNDRAP